MEERPRVVIFAGPNGSGKSTLTQILQNDPDFSFPEQYINADVIAKNSTARTQIEREREGFRKARSLRQTYREQGGSFGFETVFSHPSGLIDLQKLKSANFHVLLCFVATANPLLNVRRVAGRVESGGHDVPENKIRERYERAFQFLPRATEIAHETHVYDNSEIMRLIGIARNAVFHPSITPLPEYYEQRLVLPLTERREDRERLESSQLMGEIVVTPDEENSVHEGKVRLVTPHYVLQQTVPGRFVRHDASLLTTPVNAGAVVRITYKDGYGTPEVVTV